MEMILLKCLLYVDFSFRYCWSSWYCVMTLDRNLFFNIYRFIRRHFVQEKEITFPSVVYTFMSILDESGINYPRLPNVVRYITQNISLMPNQMSALSVFKYDWHPYWTELMQLLYWMGMICFIMIRSVCIIKIHIIHAFSRLQMTFM